MKTVGSKMAALLGYEPSVAQVKTITMLAHGKGPRDIAAAFYPRECHERSSFGMSRQWVFGLCARLGFGESDNDCARHGWAAMQTKASALVRDGAYYDYMRGVWADRNDVGS